MELLAPARTTAILYPIYCKGGVKKREGRQFWGFDVTHGAVQGGRGGVICRCWLGTLGVGMNRVAARKNCQKTIKEKRGGKRSILNRL